MATSRHRIRVLLIAVIVYGCADSAGGRRLTQTDASVPETERASGQTKSVQANFANTYASQGGNQVEQTVDLIMPDPEKPRLEVGWVRDVIPQRVDPDKPQCALGDPIVYPKELATAKPIANTALTKINFYVPPASDIRPQIIVRLDETTRDGVAEVTGPGVYGVVRVDQENLEKRICGSWAWSHFGYYSYELKVLDAFVTIEYHKRDHVPSRSASFEEFPLTFNLTVHTTVAGNGVNVLTDTSLLSKHADGKINVVLDNNIIGNSNTVSQVSRGRLEGAEGRDSPN